MKREISVDLAIIGAGTAGISAFKEANKITDKIRLIDHGPLGTTCARIGCMPSKAFIQTANFFHDRHYFAERGIQGGNHLSVNIAEMMQYVRQVRDGFTSGTINYLESLGDRFIKGSAEFIEPNLIKVDQDKIHAKKIIIATGSHSFIPPEWMAFSNQILTSENFFEQDHFENKIVVIGAGIIGLELGQALSRLGIDIDIFHSGNFIGKLSDPTVNDYATEVMQNELNLYPNHHADAEKLDDLLIVKSADKKVQTQQILAALGRRPNLANLNLEKIGIKIEEIDKLHDRRTMQLGDFPIFLAGDVNKEKPLLHEAADEGHIAGYNAMVSEPFCFRRREPLTILFTQPNIAIVGNSFKELQNSEFVVGEANFEKQGRARIMSNNRGILRIYAEKKDGKILGAEMIAPEGEHLAHMLAWTIQTQMTVFEVLKMPVYHPVIEEGMRTALRDLAKQVKNAPQNFELAMCDSEALSNLS